MWSAANSLQPHIHCTWRYRYITATRLTRA
uniref:Uncharacterized protein n=1 Tax=Anguilla anguilla TaxID=7936 RepID=A0A0E9UAS7_ANGAN